MLQQVDAQNDLATLAAVEQCLAEYLTGAAIQQDAEDGKDNIATDCDSRALVKDALFEILVPPPTSLSGLCAGTDSPLGFSQEHACDHLKPIPACIEVASPHVYAQLGAPYGGISPFQLRETVVDRLMDAQAWLSRVRPGYTLEIFDAYRPVTVQAYMVEYTLKQCLQDAGMVWDDYVADIDAPAHRKIRQRVAEIWAPPSMDPQCPPPHSTGGAVDLTILNAEGEALDMGSPIDHLGPESEANFYLRHGLSHTEMHQNRVLLNQCMQQAGFRRIPHEWWHFSYGDQWWVLLNALDKAVNGMLSVSQLMPPFVACYGRIDP